MAALIAVAGALAAYMYIRRDDIFRQHAQVAATAQVQAAQSTSMPAAAAAPVVIAPPNPGTTGDTAPTGADNAIAVYSTPSFDPAAAGGGTRIAVPAPAPSTAPSGDVAAAGDLRTTSLVGAPVSSIPTPPPNPQLAVDPATPPLAMAMIPDNPPSYSSVVGPPAQSGLPGLAVHTSPLTVPSADDPSPNMPLDTGTAQFVLPAGGPYILTPSQVCKR